MALKIDKDALLEGLVKFKDQIFIAVLIVVSIYGGWRLYSSSAQSVQQIIAESFTSGPGGGGGEEDVIESSAITAKLIAKEDRESYVLKTNPFGSPEDQLRLRQEVQTVYQRAVDLFEAGQFQASIQQFDRVISLDVTETRIKYPVLPSEYKRRAQREDARKNFDRILQSVQTDIAEGDRLNGEQKLREALNVYQRASTSVSDVIASDPDGSAIGAENFKTLQDLQAGIDQKIRAIQKTTLQQDLDTSLVDAQAASRGNDMIANLQALLELAQLQGRIANIDPNQQLISLNDRSRVNSLLEQIQSKLSGNFAMIVAQADAQFEKAIADKDSKAAQQSIWALRQSLGIAAGNDQTADARQEILKKVNAYVARRAQLVIEDTQTFYNQQKALLDQGNFAQFDQKAKVFHLAELNELLQVAGQNLTSTMKQDIGNLRNLLVSLRLPPPLTDAYTIVSVTPKSAGSVEIVYVDKTRSNSRAQREQKTRLKEGQEERRTKFTVKQVDTAGGFVILSHPDYMDVKVPLSPSN